MPIKQETTLLADTVVPSDQVGNNTKSDSDNKEGNQEPAEPVARLNAAVKEEHHHDVNANNDNDGVGNPDDDEDSFYSRWPGFRPPLPSFFMRTGALQSIAVVILKKERSTEIHLINLIMKILLFLSLVQLSQILWQTL